MTVQTRHPWISLRTLGLMIVLLMAPMLLVPGSELDIVFHLSAEMWDVRNEYLYMAAEAEGEAHQSRPVVFIDEASATAAGHGRAINLLVKELQGRLDGLHATAPSV